MTTQEEFIERMQNYSPAPDVEGWVTYIAPMIGMLAVARDTMPAELKEKYIDAMFGTMPVDVSIQALAMVTALAASMPEDN